MAEDVDWLTELSQILVAGKLTHTWDLFGQSVVYDLYAEGTAETIERRASGLDLIARRRVSENLDLAYALTSVGKVTFKDAMEEKLRFVHSLQGPVRRLFLEELASARLKQEEHFDKLRKELGKESPIPR